MTPDSVIESINQFSDLTKEAIANGQAVSVNVHIGTKNCGSDEKGWQLIKHDGSAVLTVIVAATSET